MQNTNIFQAKAIAHHAIAPKVIFTRNESFVIQNGNPWTEAQTQFLRRKGLFQTSSVNRDA